MNKRTGGRWAAQINAQYMQDAIQTGAGIDEGITVQSLREEYSRLRAVAEKRLSRLEKEGLTERAIYRENVGSFPKVSEFGKPQDTDVFQLTENLSRLTKFVENQQATVIGQRQFDKETISRLKDQGYDFINKNNIDAFYKFMSHMHQLYGAKAFDSSPRAIEGGVKAVAKAINKGTGSKQAITRAFNAWARDTGIKPAIGTEAYKRERAAAERKRRAAKKKKSGTKAKSKKKKK